MGDIYQDLTSDFPLKVSTMERVQDVNLSSKPYVDQYMTYYNAGELDKANKVIDDHPELKRMIINANIFNRLRDEIIATQRIFKDDVESYIFSVVKNKGDWSATKKYQKYNCVFYNVNGAKLPYLAIADDIPIGTLPTDITAYYPLAIRGETGLSGTGLTPRGTWSEYVEYYADDLVAYNNVLWAAKEDNIGYIPNDSSTTWYSVLSMNIAWNSIKIQNEEIDAIFDGSADLTDDETNTGDTNESISKDEIDNILNS